ncbi:uncharacterized protein [Coffea arabica]|uniref:Reverse transcriptase domain-containing protein n=1 Tax=Coffea arabica TaxID=13443 RepID=A0A6P6W458_COFAR|nr:uncharacterized protein LOC113728742 [Coffea arabica]
MDIGYEEKPWTWSNRWDNEGEIRERLDRVLGSGSWCNSFRNARCRHLETEASDHSMLLVDIKPAMGKRWKKRFVFDRNWLQHKEMGNIVKSAWNTSCIGSRFFKFQFKIKQCRVALLRWNKQKESNFGKIILQTKKEMKVLRDSNVSGKGVRLALLKKKLVAVYMDEEVYWSQKAKQKWLTEGDKNTKFYHVCVAGKRKRNRIGLIKKRDGDWCKDEEETGTEIIQYFKDIFTAEAPQGIDAILNEISQSITSVMTKQLILPVTEQEVHRAVFSMHPNKSLDPDDGFSVLLNQAVRQGKLTDLQLSSGGPRLSHLFFADDSLIFCKAKEEKAVQLMEVLRQYGDASEQLINIEKSSIFFSKNVPTGERLKVLERVRGMKKVKQSRYLGLPLEKVIRRISGWKEKLLSMAGKKMLLKSVVMALPAYVMSCCKLPKELCRGIGKEMAKF